MATCPACGNYWDARDQENHIEAAAANRSPILLVEFVRQEFDESIKRLRCTACSSEWTGRYNRRKFLGVEIWHKHGGTPPKHGG